MTAHSPKQTTQGLHVLIIGGYGEFGGRLAQLLMRDNLHVSIAGRDLNKARQFCEQHGGCPVELDINKQLAKIDSLDVDIVVDAAGPFQSYGVDDDRYRVAKKTLEAGKHYFDLSDDGHFTKGLDCLDDLAKQQHCVALSGASSTPALSGAAVELLKQPLSSIDKIETSILPGSRAPQGRSVMQAILNQVGNDVPFWRNQQWLDCPGWSEPAIKQIGSIERKANLIVAADTVLFPSYFNASTVLFRAGLAVPVMHNALHSLGVLRSKGLLPNLTKFTTVLSWLANVITPFGNDKGGMLVELTGQSVNQQPQQCTWTLEAEPGQGPFVPAIPIRALIRNLDHLPRGARACINELTLSEFEAAMDDIGVTTHTSDQAFKTLFQKTLAEDWQTLPEAVRRTHLFADKKVLTGDATITRGSGMLTRLIAWVFRFPKATNNISVQVTKTRLGSTEIWERNFNGQRFRSTLSPIECNEPTMKRANTDSATTDTAVVEQFGLLKFTLELPVIDGAMHMKVRKGSCLGVPIPRFLLPVSNTREYEHDNTMHFSVELLAPFKLGLIVHYQGWLR